MLIPEIFWSKQKAGLYSRIVVKVFPQDRLKQTGIIELDGAICKGDTALVLE